MRWAALLLLIAMVPGCCCSQIRGPAAAIARDMPLYLQGVAVRVDLSPAEVRKTEALGDALRRNVELLREASK
jgi:hypothetical protein